MSSGLGWESPGYEFINPGSKRVNYVLRKPFGKYLFLRIRCLTKTHQPDTPLLSSPANIRFRYNSKTINGYTKTVMSIPYENIIKSGTATADKGRKCVNQIMDAAKYILINEGYTKFTVRNITKKAGIHISNVYYYFPGKKELIHGLIHSIVEDYTENLKLPLVDHEISPEEQFMKVIDYLFKEISNPQVRRFFIQFWALLTADEHLADELIDEFFGMYRNRLYHLIEPINPALGQQEIKHRTVMIAAMVEGLMIILGSGVHQQTDLYGIEKSVKQQILKLATSP